MENIQLILGGLSLYLLGQGIIYGWQIRVTPVEPGYTWLSVATGTLMVAAGQMFAIFVLYHFGRPDLAILVPPIGLLLLGVPMAAFQIFKKWQINRKKDEIKEKRDFAQ